MNKISEKTVIWDLDGTLLDSFGLFVDIVKELAIEFQKEIPDHDTILNNYHASLSDIFKLLFAGSSDKDISALLDSFLEKQNVHYEVIDHHLYSDAVSLAKHLEHEGKKQIVVTNRNNAGHMNASPANIIQKSTLATAIEHVIAGDDSEHRKPKPAVVEKLLVSGYVDPTDTVVIGDQLVDLEFARNLNARAILITRDHTSHLVDMITDDYKDFVTVVDSLNKIHPIS